MLTSKIKTRDTLRKITTRFDVSEALRKLTLTSDMIRGRHKAERI